MGGRKEVYRWTADAVALLTRRYMAGDTRAVIAAELGVSPLVVARKIERLGLATKLSPDDRRARKLATSRHMAAVGMAKRAAAGEFVWSDAQIVELRRLYLVELRSASDVAAIMGCKPRDVSRKAYNTGMTAGRDAAVRQRERQQAQQLGAARAAEARAAERAAKPAAMTDAELIAAAVAAGRVRQVASGYACGLTGLERYLWASGPLSGRKPSRVRGSLRARAL